MPKKNTLTRLASVSAVASAPVDVAFSQSSDVIAFNPSAAARLLGVGRTFLYEAISNGGLKASKIGGRLITMDAIRAWLKANEQ